MFGLENVTFKAKVIIVSVIVIIISSGIIYIKNKYPITVVKIDDWVFISHNSEGNWYYKANLVNIDNHNHIISVWVKVIYAKNGKQKFRNTHKIDKYKDIYRSLVLILIDCQKMDYHEEKVVNYAESGEILGADELSGKHLEFMPKSVGDKLLVKILEDYRIKK